MNMIDLFSGIGGFSLGFEQAGFKVVAHVEKDAKCRKLLMKQWPDAVMLDDVCDAWHKKNFAIRKEAPKELNVSADVVTFGFP